MKKVRMIQVVVGFLMLTFGPSFSGSAQEQSLAGDDAVAGYIFGQPVSVNNYQFARYIAYRFPRLGHEQLTQEERERVIWESLILHYEAFQQGIENTDDKLEAYVNKALKSEKKNFTRQGDPESYKQWVTERIGVEVEMFENYMLFLLAIDTLKDQMRESFDIAVTEDAMKQEFLNEKHHVGGEMVTLDSEEAAEAFYEKFKEPDAWDAMKESGEYEVRPVSTMTLEAYINLWSVPKEKIYAFHALEVGSVGEPIPFGTTQWSVYRLLDKRSGDLADFPKERESYQLQLVRRGQYEALNKWIEDLKEKAQLEIIPLE